jgi:hypothetical protein
MRKRTGIGGTEAFLIQSDKYGNDSETLGNASFADYPWYGTDKFFFIEDNTIEFGAATDSSKGARFVYRHNYNINAVVTDHGTEGGYSRGQRAKEVYNNTFHWTEPNPGPSGGQRGGTSLWHDNHITGSANINNGLCGLPNNRETYVYATPFWGIANGTSPWDANDTEGNETFIEGHPPYLFARGSATGGTVTLGAKATFTDSTKNWTPNQWIGYSIKKVGATASYGSYIIGNGAHSITYAYVASTGANLRFNPGDTYEIHRVLVMMDQNGRGKGDRIINHVNSRTGRASWPRQALEPCFSWNNVYTPTGAVYGFRTRLGQPTTKANIDFFNLNAGFPADATPAQVSATYSPALNGVAYSGPFTYPHPLVSGSRTPALPSPIVTTNPATKIASFSAALNSSVNPNGSTTTVYFQWGATTSYGHNTPKQTQTGNTYRNIPANISGLSASHLYHFRIVATNSAGTRVGSDRTFNTP